jgi:hypothetical protein
MEGPPAYLPRSYLGWSVLSALLFFVPTGIVAIVYSVLVKRRLAAGDWVGAARASRLARTWCLVSVAIGVMVFLLVATGVVHNPYASH